MSRRISLTRVIAINWYGFRQIFDVEDNVLISGAFGTGKSALLDLIQYVLLGEHWRANRAAAGNARGRDLVGYCLGDTNQTREGRRHFLRQSGVTLVGLEFTRAPDDSKAEPVRETWGIRLQYHNADAAPSHTYFCVPERLEYAAIAPDGKLMPEETFRAWLRREYGNESLFGRQRDYLEEMAVPRHLNFDSQAFCRTFPKAIAFEVEDNVEKFLREFVLEASPLDVGEVRAALRAYDDTRRRLERQEDEAAFLRRIEEHHQRHEDARKEEGILKHVGVMLKLQQATESHDRHAAEVARLEAEHAEDLKSLEAARTEAAKIESLLGAVRFEITQDPEGGKLAQLDSEKRRLQAEIAELKEAQKSTREQLDERHRRWMDWLQHGNALAFEGLKPILVIEDGVLARLRTGSDTERMEAMRQMAEQFTAIWDAVRELLRPLEEAIRSDAGRLAQIQMDLEKLKNRRMPGAFPLFEAAQQKLGDRVEQLGRLIEVKPEAERWWPALELFLASQRWALIVDGGADYRSALEILRQTNPGREKESLVNPSEAAESRVMAGTLFDKVEVTHAGALAYVRQLLGEVVCVESAEEIESVNARAAITPDGHLKTGALRRRLPASGAVALTLGREGLERMRAARQKEWNDLQVGLEARKRQLEDVRGWLDSGKNGGLSDTRLPDAAPALGQLPKLESDLDRIQATLDLLSTPERAARQARLREAEESQKRILSQVAVLQERRNNFDLKVRPHREGLARAGEERESGRITVELSRTQLEGQFGKIPNIETRGREFRQQFPKWNDCFEAVQKAESAAGAASVEAQGCRNRERLLLATSRDAQGALRHPEYQGEFSTEDPSNAAWSARLRALESVELEKSRQLAADRKSEWERRLEDNILNELNRRITQATNTIRQLDRFLSKPVGKFRYRISQRKDTAGFGAIWSLLNSGLEPTDPLATALADSDGQRAKDELMRAIDAPDDDRAKRLLDYRNYHHYDLEMVPADKPDAPPISLGRSGRNLSGGESQAPFFISMLAAFRRVYDRGDRTSTRSQQIGLVIMDEAFSKLSGDGIEDCLALARNFQLQLVMAFPPERLGVMVPHAQTVIMCQKNVERDRDGYVTGITNIPLITTMADAMEALA